METVPDHTGSGARWLLPSEALERFQPPARALAELAPRRAEERARYGFRAAGLGFLIAAGTGSEVVEARGISPLPRSAPWLVGVMNLRGRPVPVFDLAVALELDRAGAEKRMVLVLDKGAEALGLLIDGFPVALRGLRATATPVALPPRLAPFAPAVLTAEKAWWIEFDHKELFRSLADVVADSGTLEGQ
ncbi:MAG TPA: chemotaxis protein CheW [Burkholderiaceae bacterium]|nr:chemotaxis protein CheW [Burkholderiaceae bacterium]